MALDLRTLQGFDMDALKNELNNRQNQIEELKKSYDWAIKEHEEQISQLKLAIAWKEQHGDKNRRNS